MMLTRERVLELFDINTNTGAVIWKKPTSSRVHIGRPVGKAVGIDGVQYARDHVVFLALHGKLPSGGESFGAIGPGWKVVPGFSSAYEVSDQGQVRSRARAVAQASGAVRFWPARLLKPKRQQKNKYLCVTLRDATTGAMQHVTVHSLVAAAFLPSKPEGTQVRHRDGCSENNRADNLEWGTELENMHDQYRHGTRIASTWHHSAKLTADLVQQIRESSETGAAIARRLGLSVSTVCRARKGKTYAVLSRDQLPALLAGA